MEIFSAISGLKNEENEISVSDYMQKLEELIRNDCRMRLIPYWYPYNVYNKPQSNASNEMIKKSWLESRNESDDAAIYIHIPFCKQKCGYCQWYTIIKSSDEYENYTQSLIKEIDMYHSIVNFSKKKIKSIYFGGGTPNLLSIDQITRIVKKLRSCFDLSCIKEFSIEVFPDYLDQEYLSSLKGLGFNRISMGIQTFDSSALAGDYKRTITDAEEKYTSIISLIKKNGFMLCIDMLSDLPNQTFERMQMDFDKVISISPDQIAYAYTEFRNSSMKDAIYNVTPYINRKSCYFHASNRLAYNNYQQIDDMMFTKTGVPLFWVDLRAIASVEIAFGPKGRGYTFNGSVYINGDYDYWKNEIANNNFPVFSINKLTYEDLILKYIITAIYYGRIDLDEFKKRFGESVENVFAKRIEALLKLGLLCYRKYDGNVCHYNHMGINETEPNILELTEMGKHYVEALRIIFTNKKYRRMLLLEQSFNTSDNYYKKFYDEIL